MLQQFLIQGRFIAEAPRNPVRECNPLFRTSAHYYCERCGEIYATVLVSPCPFGWTTYRGTAKAALRFLPYSFQAPFGRIGTGNSSCPFPLPSCNGSFSSTSSTTQSE